MSASLDVSYHAQLFDWMHLQPVSLWLQLQVSIVHSDSRRQQQRDGPKIIRAAKDRGPFSEDLTHSLRAITQSTLSIITCVCHQIRARGQHSMTLAETALAVDDAAEWMVSANNALLLGIGGALRQSEIRKWWHIVFELPCNQPQIIEHFISQAPA